MASPTLASNTLAEPQEYTETREFRGGAVVLADGTQHTDLVQASAKRLFRLEWVALTTTQKGTLQTAFDAMLAAGTATYEDLDAVSYTVTADGQASIEFRAVKASGGKRWAASLALREA